MNRILFVLVAVTFVWSGSTTAQEVDVYLLGGQSNGDGRARISQVTDDPANLGVDASILTNSNVMLWDGLRGGSWGTLAPQDPTWFGPDITMGSRLAELNPGRQIAIIKYAPGGTSLY